MKYALSEMAAVCGGVLAGRDITAGSVFSDSRAALPGGVPLFAAIAGRNHDGHAYIGELYRRGVRAFMVERDVEAGDYPDAGFVRVANSVTALQALAADWRSRFKGTVVGITGSNGKTVVKEWAAALAPAGVTLFRSPKSYNSQIGVPLSLLMAAGDEDVVLVEAGISQPGEMARLAAVVRPDVGIITTLGDAHQENFSSHEEKAAEKLQLFAGVRTIIYNSAYPLVENALREAYPQARLFDAACETEAREIFGDEASRQNAAAAVALWDVLGYDHTSTVARLASLQPVAMRLELKEGINDSLIVNDSYNSDINSLAIALDYLAGVAGGRPQTLVLSDILQSGFAERELYTRVGQMVARSGVDRLVGIGERIRLHADMFDVPHADFHPTTEAYLAAMGRDDFAGRAVLVKGNRSSQFERLTHALESKSHTTVLEIDLDAMIHNLNVHRAMLPSGVRVMAMVKAAGYGNGSHEVAAMLQHQGVEYLAVAFADEGVALRRRGITIPIVVLNADADSFGLMIDNGLEPEIYNFESLAGFAAALGSRGERSYPVHIKLDTGMHRLGFEESDMLRLIAELERLSGLVRVSSVFSHLACADEPEHDEFTLGQIALFDKMSSRLSGNPIRHIANSAGIARFPQAVFDMVRLGIGLYGICEPRLCLRPVSMLRSRIVQVKELAEGETVGYGREGVVRGTMRVAVIPVGYADGLDRRLGNGQWKALVGGEPVPTIGRISMDTCALDVTGTDVRVGDEVVIFGPTPGHTVEDMAHVLGTIPYEVMTSVDARVKRIFIKE